MTYLPVALIGYLLLSIAILIDKAILDRDIPNPIVYTFYLGVLSFSSLLLIPFGFLLPSETTLTFGFLSGVYFTCAWVFYYKALRVDEASKLSPISGTLNPIFTILLGFLLLGQTTTQNQLYAFLILVLGMVVLNFNQLFGQKIRGVHLGLALGAAFFFAASAVFLREAFLSSNFITGLVISRVSVGVSVLVFLFFKKYRDQILKSRIQKHHFVNKSSRLLLFGQLSGALGGFLLAYAISLNNPAIISALAGVQYIFVLLGVLLLSKKLQRLLEENLTPRALRQKILGGVIISIGLAILAVS